MARRERTSRLLLSNGDAVNIKVMDGLIIDDIVVQGVKAEGYRVMTSRDRFPEIGRSIKDYLVKINVIQD